jgi:hypothetical protein
MSNTQPLVGVATFCERLLVEEGGVITAVRIVDTYNIQIPPNAPEAVPGVEIHGLITLRSGDVVGERTISLVMHNPQGERQILSPEGGWRMTFKGGENGVNIRLQFMLGVKNYGLCWFDVVCDDEVLTRIPLMLRRVEQEKPIAGQGSR